ncbi:hypothetical protein BEI02_09735 [Elizabethkingia sp. HvH-WGS333]|nr:hypothetical protein AMC91_15890 [Elizabethkingia miricola]OIK48004.1 hypothetical protein BEI02_09735 [Elizabethkingia sp. HvH-WGS333]
MFFEKFKQIKAPKTNNIIPVLPKFSKLKKVPYNMLLNEFITIKKSIANIKLPFSLGIPTNKYDKIEIKLNAFIINILLN